MDPVEARLRWGPALPMALARLHRRLDVGQRAILTLSGEPERAALDGVLEGAGFARHRATAGAGTTLDLVRQHTLPDTVGPKMRLLLCGLNPSIYSADAGVGFARPGNRFWPALRLAGLTELDRDALQLLRRDRLGMTDLVKRPSVGAAELTAAEYRHGLERVAALCAWLRPAAVVFVGLAGWRAAADRVATSGWQPAGLGPTPVYLMPSTSGLNAHSSLQQLADHLRTAADRI